MRMMQRLVAVVLFGGLMAQAAAGQVTASEVTPLRLTPAKGSFEGGQLLFVEVAEPNAGKGKSSIFCRFAAGPKVPGKFDKASGHYVCRVPAHPRPQAVKVTIIANGKSFLMAQRYVYTTHGKYDAPVTQIHVARFVEQVKAVTKRIPAGVKLCAVLKNGNPPGWLGKIIEDNVKVDYFCIPRLQDGIALRRAGVTKPIIVMYLTEAAQVPQLLHYDLQPAAYSLQWIKEAGRRLARSGRKLKVHLWIDTGISREGVLPQNALALARAVEASPLMKLQGIATHFCCLDEDDLEELKKGNLDNETTLQKDRFDKIVKAIRAEGIGRDAILHASSSDGLRYGLTPVYYDMLRIGTMLFENPVPKNRNYTWKTKIMQVKTLPKGWCVNYGCERRLQKDTKVGAVVHIPDDGVTYYLRGKPVKRLIDHEVMIILDLSEVPDAREGEDVTMVFDGDDSPLDTSYSAPVTLQGGPANR